jgi:putative flippase GtrA
MIKIREFKALAVASGPARYLIVGLICAVAHNAIVLGADRLGLHYAVGCVLSYVLVVLLGFALHVRFTFGATPTPAGFWRYAVSMAANYPLMLALLFVMCDVAGWPVAIAAPLATVLLMAWNFVASRWALAHSAPVKSHDLSSRHP